MAQFQDLLPIVLTHESHVILVHAKNNKNFYLVIPQ